MDAKDENKAEDNGEKGAEGAGEGEAMKWFIWFIRRKFEEKTFWDQLLNESKSGAYSKGVRALLPAKEGNKTAEKGKGVDANQVACGGSAGDLLAGKEKAKESDVEVMNEKAKALLNILSGYEQIVEGMVANCENKLKAISGEDSVCRQGSL